MKKHETCSSTRNVTQITRQLECTSIDAFMNSVLKLAAPKSNLCTKELYTDKKDSKVILLVESEPTIGEK